MSVPGEADRFSDALLGSAGRRYNQDSWKAVEVVCGGTAVTISVVGLELGCVLIRPLGSTVKLQKEAKSQRPSSVTTVAVWTAAMPLTRGGSAPLFESLVTPEVARRSCGRDKRDEDFVGTQRVGEVPQKAIALTGAPAFATDDAVVTASRRAGKHDAARQLASSCGSKFDQPEGSQVLFDQPSVAIHELIRLELTDPATPEQLSLDDSYARSRRAKQIRELQSCQKWMSAHQGEHLVRLGGA